MFCCEICIDENTQVCTATYSFWATSLISHNTKLSIISHVAGEGAAPSVLRMILIVAIMY